MRGFQVLGCPIQYLGAAITPKRFHLCFQRPYVRVSLWIFINSFLLTLLHGQHSSRLGHEGMKKTNHLPALTKVVGIENTRNSIGKNRGSRDQGIPLRRYKGKMMLRQREKTAIY